MRVLFSNESVRLELRYLSLTPRFSEVLRSLCLSLTASAVSPERAKPLKRLRLWRCKRTSLKRGVNNIDHSDAADSFCAGCLTGAGRVAAARRAAFLRRKYATRRLRLIRTRAAVPWNLYGLKIAETQSALKPIVLFLRTVSRLKDENGSGSNLRWQSP